MNNAQKGLVCGLSSVSVGVVGNIAIGFPYGIIFNLVALAVGLSIQWFVGKRPDKSVEAKETGDKK